MFEWLMRRLRHKHKTTEIIISLMDGEDEMGEIIVEGDFGDRFLAEALKRDKLRMKRLKKEDYVV